MIKRKSNLKMNENIEKIKEHPVFPVFMEIRWFPSHFESIEYVKDIKQNQIDKLYSFLR